MPTSDKSRALGKYAAAVRWGHAPADIADSRRDLAAAQIADYVERIVADAPPLTESQLDRVTALLRAGGAQ